MSSELKPSEVVWNPGDYAQHSSSQQSWGRKLISRLHLAGDEAVLDIGCGDGKVTAELAAVVPRGAVVGIDASAEMIAFSERAFPRAQFPNLSFRVMDARMIELGEQFDVVFSNAALHWVDDHALVFKGIAGCLKPGGRVMISCGGKGNANAVFHALRGVMRLPQFRQYFRRMSPPYFFFSADQYREWLPQLGFSIREVTLADTAMLFESSERFAGWLRTTWLPYTQRVPELQRDAFVADVIERYVREHPADAHGRIQVAMVRLELDAIKV
ncbi:MAG TPA: methyltransferase domain-containing protein [Verrucomicrobiae bacterium]|nr:methyltransferase domain-containing protein [Verrucomicrobiae bacterium]